MEHTKHIIRGVLLLLVFVLTFIVVRHFAIPRSFGESGHYRKESVHEIVAQEPVHAGAKACVECHEEEGTRWSSGKHGTVGCEVCHGPLGTHPDASDMPTVSVNRSYTVCAWCHEAIKARPGDFPQVNLRDHVSEFGGEMREDVCLECHNDPHNPSG